MTTTKAPSPQAAANPAALPTGRSAVRRTVLTLVASMLGATPLKGLLVDSGWLVDVWMTMIVVIAPAIVLRRRREPSALDIWPGIILLIPWLTLRFVPHHAWGRVIPTGATMSDLGHLMNSLHHTTNNEVAPIHTTLAVRLVLCALLGLLAALIDLIAVVGRRGALAGVPLLVIYTVSGAVPRTPVPWFWFIVASIGFLMLLAVDADDELRGWGRRIPHPGGTRGRPALAVSAQRIGMVALVGALAVPLLVPEHPRNLIANLFHNGGGTGIGGFGAGGSDGTSINPFVAMKGELIRDKAVPLMNVHVDGQPAVQPFYVRTNVLDRYTEKGWSVSNHGSTERLTDTGFNTDPPSTESDVVNYQARITITGLSGNAPVFAEPLGVGGVDSNTTWSSRDQLLLGATVRRGDEITEEIAQPAPSIASLQSAETDNSADMSRWLDVPPMPSYVTQLVASITKNASGPYAKARALSDYFADPSNNFAYSLRTKAGDSGSALVDFLKNKVGFCQQYAAAMGIMLRQAGVPSRVVLGYMHSPPNKNGDFTITTFDAHAWVEAYFIGLGWVPFDPTPTSGLSGGKQGDLVWAPHVFGANGGTDVPNLHQTSTGGARPSNSTSSTALGRSAGTGASTGSNAALAWIGLALLVLIGLGLVPAGVRMVRRRRRYAAARRGDPGPLWAELSDTAVDLGYVWSPARSPRQVAQWLSRDAAGSAGSLEALAVAVEHSRYAPDAQAQDGVVLSEGLQRVTGELRARRSGGARLRAALWPSSLGWDRWFGLHARVRARRRR